MLKINIYLCSLFLGALIIGLSNNQQAFARHHHKDSPPPPITVPKDTSLNPQQIPEDVTSFAHQAAENAKKQQITSKPEQNGEKKGPPALLPGHFTKDTGKLNGSDGWVNSKRRVRKGDLGINAPLPQTGDPTQNRTRGVFRRAMPIYEPNY